MALDMKKTPSDYFDALKHKSLLMLFDKPSLRTRVSLEAGMTQLGGHSIAYMTGDSPIGAKESYEDTGAVLSRYVDAVTARVQSRTQIAGLAAHSTIPIVNALDDYAHPMQLLADLQTMVEKTGGGLDLSGLTLAFVGDPKNNVAYDLMRAGVIMGLHVKVSGPPGPAFATEPSVFQECAALEAALGAQAGKDTGHGHGKAGFAPGSTSPGTATRVATAEEAVAGADFVYADSWLSYGLGPDLEAVAHSRLRELMPWRVDAQLMAAAHNKDTAGARFMHCLPAIRGLETTSQVIDGPQSIVFDQAENRLHSSKALLVHLILRQL